MGVDCYSMKLDLVYDQGNSCLVCSVGTFRFWALRLNEDGGVSGAWVIVQDEVFLRMESLAFSGGQVVINSFGL